MTETVTAETLTSTRRALHRVAEHVLSAARKRATGEITLTAGMGGVRTPRLPDGRVLALVDDRVVVIGADGSRRQARVTTVRAAAELVGTEPGFPWTKHPPGTAFAPDEALRVDPVAAGLLAAWFALGDAALRRLVADLGPEDPPAPVVYPEHLDLAVTVDEVNYGASPGDDAIPSPYLYVGPWAGAPAGGDPFWDAPFGASRAMGEVPDVDSAVAFFREGHDRLAGDVTGR